MADVIIVGDGPGGLSAALYLAKNGHGATVYGQDKTAMHAAELFNYLGIYQITGSEFQALARRQVEAHGAELVDAEVTEARLVGDRVHVEVDGLGSVEGDYLVLAAGKTGTGLARQLGLDPDRDGLEVDGQQRTALDRVYAVGRLTRPGRSQAIVSAGAGAVAALDILSREAGKDVRDWDDAPTDE